MSEALKITPDLLLKALLQPSEDRRTRVQRPGDHSGGTRGDLAFLGIEWEVWGLQQSC